MDIREGERLGRPGYGRRVTAGGLRPGRAVTSGQPGSGQVSGPPPSCVRTPGVRMSAAPPPLIVSSSTAHDASDRNHSLPGGQPTGGAARICRSRPAGRTPCRTARNGVRPPIRFKFPAALAGTIFRRPPARPRTRAASRPSAAWEQDTGPSPRRRRGCGSHRARERQGSWRPLSPGTKGSLHAPCFEAWSIEPPDPAPRTKPLTPPRHDAGSGPGDTRAPTDAVRREAAAPSPARLASPARPASSVLSDPTPPLEPTALAVRDVRLLLTFDASSHGPSVVASS